MDRLYGVATGDERHLEICPECAARWRRIEMRRREVLAKTACETDELSAGFLAAQRRAIYTRLDRPQPRFTPKWAMGLAALLLMTVGLSVWRPGQQATPVPAVTWEAEISDSQLFEELAALDRAPLPRAAAPLQNLFEQEH